MPFLGSAQADSVLSGYHFQDLHNTGRSNDRYPYHIYPLFEDYLEHFPEELERLSFADFWRWWYSVERYKGDELGLRNLEWIADACLSRGIKIKIDLAWNTFWAMDGDWITDVNLAAGPENEHEFAHLCLLLGRRLRGKIAVWDLQGEANDLANYWQGRSIEHVQRIYRAGYRALKSVDPGCLVGVSGASPSVSREELDRWYESNIKALAGLYDNIPINYFADVADPYGGALPYYESIRGFLDEARSGAEIGMGETSVQWAETTELALRNNPLGIRYQAATLNKMYADLFAAGMNKFIVWATEYAPTGGHWPWRWGLRDYEDCWNIWPAESKLPGTRIVSRYTDDNGEVRDLSTVKPRPGDPYYPAWDVFCHWSRLAPPGGESVRLPLRTGSPCMRGAAAWHRAFNRVTAVLYSEMEAVGDISLNLADAGWPDGAPVRVSVRREELDFSTGYRTLKEERSFVAAPDGHSLSLPVALGGYTTLELAQEQPDDDVEFLHIAPAGDDGAAVALVRNTGRRSWDKNFVTLMSKDGVASGTLPHRVEPGQFCAIPLDTGADSTGATSRALRMHSDGQPFGPWLFLPLERREDGAPRKLVAHSQNGRVLLQWFPDRAKALPAAYIVYRGGSLEGPYEPIARVPACQCADIPPEFDTHYYYRVCAEWADGTASGPSLADTACARSDGKRRLYDGEIQAEMPESVVIGTPMCIEATVRNTGTRSWVAGPDGYRFGLFCTQLWGRAQKAPEAFLPFPGEVPPGESVRVAILLAGPREGVHENHWIVGVEKPAQFNTPFAPFGTPLLCETAVLPKLRREGR